jgi:hypothetical protein
MASLVGSGAALPFGRGAGMPLGAARAVAEVEAVYAPEPVYERAPRAEVRDLPAVGPMPAPPAMIGPLATSEMEEQTMDPLREAGVPDLAPEAPVPKPILPPKDPEPNLEDYPVERCARIAVSIVCRPQDAAKTLEENKLSEKGWGTVKNHWLEAIRNELGRGKNTLLKRYDEAYVGQVEVERGPIVVEEYARLAVASERGRVSEAVVAMGLPPGAPMRIERIWMERMALDSKFGEAVRDAVEKSRAE